MEFKQYLIERVAPSTAKRYEREVELFFSSVENPKTATYQQIMDYLGEVRKQKKGKQLAVILHAIKKYYSYLLAADLRQDHPCRYIKLRDKSSRDIQLQDLFKTEELEILLEKKERYILLKNRNQIIISLLIYQALTNGEVKKIDLNDINLEQGTIYIKPGRKTNSRTLKLQAKQIYWLMKYLYEDRPKLLKIESEKLIISSRGTAETGEGIGYLIETCRHLFPNKKLNAKTIRQSVITNLLKSGADLRLVQAFAGHKYPSTTERYKQTQVEELKNQILKYHPLQ